MQRAPGSNGVWTYKRDGVRKVLYRLPEVVRASDVIICEDEKDAERVATLKLSGHASAPLSRVAATTNFDGAGKWRPEYSPYFTGKHAVILPDNDPVGKNHARQIAALISPDAMDVRIVELSGLGDHGDVSDYPVRFPSPAPDSKGLMIDISVSIIRPCFPNLRTQSSSSGSKPLGLPFDPF
jgi:hypothetical protein